MFNLSGSELIFLIIIALVVLGPDKLPDAMRKAGKAYADFKKMTTGFQNEMKSVLDEPMRELRETAELAKQSAMWDMNAETKPVSGSMADHEPKPAPPKPMPEPAAEPDSVAEVTEPDVDPADVDPADVEPEDVEPEPVSAAHVEPDVEPDVMFEPGAVFEPEMMADIIEESTEPDPVPEAPDSSARAARAKADATVPLKVVDATAGAGRSDELHDDEAESA